MTASQATKFCKQRDPRLDLWRGAAVVSVVAIHISGNELARSIKDYTLFDAAEILIFISGYLSGRAVRPPHPYQSILLPSLISRSCRRIAVLYVAYVALSVCCLTIIHRDHWSDSASSICFDRWYLTLGDCLLLRADFGESSVLVLYLVFAFFIPLLAIGFSVFPTATILCVLTIYLSTQILGINTRLSGAWGERWYFNPLAWQVLFCFAFYLGFKPAVHIKAWSENKIFVAISAFLLWLGFMSKLCFSEYLILTDKRELQLLRIVHFFSALILWSYLVSPRSGWLQSRWLRTIRLCGTHSLLLYCLGTIIGCLCEPLLKLYGTTNAQVLATLTVCCTCFVGAHIIDALSRRPNTAECDGSWKLTHKERPRLGQQCTS